MIKSVLPCTIRHSNNDYYMRMSREAGNADCNINIENAQSRTIGGSSFKVNKETKRIEKVAMALTTNADKSKGFGTALHLGHVQSLVKNRLNEICLMSFKDSILFHAKFGFCSDIQDVKHMATALNTVAQTSDERLSGPRKAAVRLLKTTSVMPIADEAENRLANIKYIFSLYRNSSNTEASKKSKKLTHSEENFLKKGNKVLDLFLRKLIKLDLPRDEAHRLADFKVPFNMKLSKSLVFKNKDFYNSLYKKFNMNFRLK